MNYGRITIAAVAGTIVDAVYGFVIYGNVLTSEFARFPGVYRPAADTSYMPILFGGVFLAALAAAYIYAKGYEGGAGPREGVRFGVVLGLFALGYSGLVNYAVLNIDSTLGLYIAIAGFVEWVLVGAVIGTVYKPGALARKPLGV
jgi:hypothetical protein